MNVPKEILTQHVAVLGKTGSGKTSTAKLAIEQVVADGARVCVLDPIKSDWWGLTSSRDGTRPGLPFHILGGPHGHVPLHSSAGKAIAEIVGSGALPLSIIDMADFEPGGLQRFFVPFAETLLKRMRGVLYLVIEEAHEFAPKERAGFDHENLAIHFAKKLATAGRSKGIRMVLATQRTQALHNAMLGSCDTLIVHRMTAPADQEPVIKWLKANTSKEVLEQVANSLASLTTGHGWVCSGEAKIFQAMHFKRIATYDNTATPTGDVQTRDVKTAPVDTERLRAIIGDAVEKAKADDPKALRTKIADLERMLKLEQGRVANAKTEIVNVPLVTDEQLRTLDQAVRSLEQSATTIAFAIQTWRGAIKVRHVPTRHDTSVPVPTRQRTPKEAREKAVSEGQLSSGERKILAALAQYPDGRTKVQVAILTGYAHTGGGFTNYLSALRTKGWIRGDGDMLRITPAGEGVLGPVEPLPTGYDLCRYWQSRLSSGEWKILDYLVQHYPDAMPKQMVAEQCGYAVDGGGFNNYLSKLRTLELIEGRTELRASEVFAA